MSIERPDMFYEARPDIFKKARELRKTMTPSEKLLWEHLKGKKMLGQKFRRQHPLAEFIADFYCHSIKLVIEIDGGIHQIPEYKNRDKERDNMINKYSLKILRFTNEEIQSDIDSVLEKIKKVITTAEK